MGILFFKKQITSISQHLFIFVHLEKFFFHDHVQERFESSTQTHQTFLILSAIMFHWCRWWLRIRSWSCLRRLRRICRRSRRAWSSYSRTGQPRRGSRWTSFRKRGCFWTARRFGGDCGSFRKDHGSRKRLRRRRPRRTRPRPRPLVTRVDTIVCEAQKGKSHFSAEQKKKWNIIPFQRFQQRS